jgi:DNA-binding response OmpR family regulator
MGIGRTPSSRPSDNARKHWRFQTLTTENEALRGRISALLRRADRRPARGCLRAAELQVDPASREVRLRGDRVVLSQKEFALLRALVAEPTRVYTKEELLRSIWGYRAAGSTRTLDSHACRLRQKLGVHGDRYVVNVWGVGYRLVDAPQLQLAAADGW